MTYLLNISSGPHSAFTRASLNFAQAALDNGDVITGCFFQGDAVALFSSDNPNPTLKKAWMNFLSSIDQQALCCSAAASTFLKPGSLEMGTSIVGLGELISLSQNAKVVCFGEA